MYSLTIYFGNAPAACLLMFKTEERAKEAHTVCADSPTYPDEKLIAIEDDFGQKALIQANSFQCALLEDMAASQVAHVEQALHRARTQTKAQQAAEADSALRHARHAQGPAMIMPGMGMPNGRFSQ